MTDSELMGLALEEARKALAQRVQENATLFAGLEALIAGVEGMHRDAVEALSDFGQIAAYDFSGGWPPV